MHTMNRILVAAGLTLLSLGCRAQILSFPHLDANGNETEGATTTTAADDTKAADASASVSNNVGGVTASPVTPSQPLSFPYGYCNRRAIVEAQPEYTVAIAQLEALRRQYEQEVEHNESDFRRQYQEYLYGQKDFPQAILLKRQRDLQASMEKGLAFRTEADALLKQAERDLVAPVEQRVDAAIRRVAAARGYEYVVDTGAGVYLYLNPLLSEDISEYVKEELQ